MRDAFLAGLALSALVASGPAGAADLPVKAPVAPVPAMVQPDWTGFYIGAHAGFLRMRTQWSGTSVITVSETFRDDSAMAGGQAGFNWQLPGTPLVLGVEGDGSWTDVHATSTPTFCTPLCHSEMKWLATIRGRLGFAAGMWMFYGTGGAAFAGVHTHTTALLGFDRRDTLNGWTVGGGLEARLAQNWSVKAEYLYVDLDDQLLTVDTSVGPPPLTLRSDFTRLHVVRFGLNYRFGVEPVVARY